MSFEVAGFLVGVVGAIWLKISMNLTKLEKEKSEIERMHPRLENPALEAFIKGISLILIGFGVETFARLFLR
ncbi:MAG: hypothetical protein ACE5HC_07935 [Candidatus Binatia bacterium]